MKGSIRLIISGVIVISAGFGMTVFSKNETVSGASSVAFIAGILLGVHGWDARVESLKKAKDKL